MSADLESIRHQLRQIVERAGELETRFHSDLALVHPEFSASARNLLHYVALRQFDVGDLQKQLSKLGLSSLGRAERHVAASVGAVQRALDALSGGSSPDDREQELAFEEGTALFDRNSRAVLGDHPPDRAVSIMVTLPAEAADDYDFVHDLVASGMDIARINCAHDSRETWEGMIDNFRRASGNLGKRCRIMMDLGGPKFRTGLLRPGPKVLRLRPRRDALGNPVAPRRVRCIADDEPWTGKKFAVVPVPRACVESAAVGDELRFKDTRGRKRLLEVVARDDKGLVLELHKTAYIGTGLRFRLVKHGSGERQEFRFGELPAVEEPIVLRVDDLLVLTRDWTPGSPAVLETDGSLRTHATVSCRPVEVFDQVAVGDPVILNDGKISGVVEVCDGTEMRVRITAAKPTGSRLRSNKGINFPRTDLDLSGITAGDREVLPFVVEHADAIALSFVRRAEDVVALQDELGKYPGRNPAIVVKVETERAYRKLPQIILAAMRNYPAGLMIARGDLAVECGWVSLAEIQEEILWLAEAAHLPVIWATQVLEAEAKKGLPTRAEITDAAMSQRADCVMLNKGPNILGAIHMLDKILRKMQRHQDKKTAKLVRLSISEI
jgi:pyruvate kinase